MIDRSGVLKRARQAEAEGLAATDPGAKDSVGEESFAAVVELTERYRGVVDTVRRADEHVARGSDAIAAYPDGFARRALLAAAEYAATRTR